MYSPYTRINRVALPSTNVPSREKIDLCLPHRYAQVVDIMAHYQRKAWRVSLSNWCIAVPSNDRIRANPYMYFEKFLEEMFKRLDGYYYRQHRISKTYYFDLKEDRYGYVIYLVIIESLPVDKKRVHSLYQLHTALYYSLRDMFNQHVNSRVVSYLHNGIPLKRNQLRGMPLIVYVDKPWVNTVRYIDKLSRECLLAGRGTRLTSKGFLVSIYPLYDLASSDMSKENKVRLMTMIGRFEGRPEYEINKIKRMVTLAKPLRVVNCQVERLATLTDPFEFKCFPGALNTGYIFIEDIYKSICYNITKSLAIDTNLEENMKKVLGFIRISPLD